MSQNAWNTFRVPVISDGQALRFFDELVKKFPPSNFTLNLPGMGLGEFSNFDAVSSSIPNRKWDDTKVVSEIRANLSGGAFFVTYRRSVTSFEGGQRMAPSMWENEIIVERRDNPAPKPSEFLDVLAEVDVLKGKYIANLTALSAAPENSRDLIATQVAQLGDLHVRISHDAERQRLEANSRAEERAAALEQEWAGRRKGLEEEHKARAAALADQEAMLDAKRKELDDRGHMHARRELRGQITGALKDRLAKPEMSNETSNLRRSIALLAIFGILAFIGYAGYAAIDVHTILASGSVDPVALGFSSARFLLPAAAATGLLFYLLDWWRRIHAEDLRSERELERYRYDIDRASWIAETLLEAKTDVGTVLPGQWIAGATHNLFARSESRDDEEAALHGVAALLGLSAKAKLGPDGAELEINKRGLNKLAGS